MGKRNVAGGFAGTRHPARGLRITIASGAQRASERDDPNRVPKAGGHGVGLAESF